MRGRADSQLRMFFSINVEERIRKNHPLRPIKKVVDEILCGLSAQFDAAYSKLGRPGVPPERLLKALLLQTLYSVRSERQLVERIDTDLLFRWFLDMDPAEDVFVATDFTKNRPRLDEHGLTAAFFQTAVDAGLTSDDHFSVDGTLIESCASVKSFRPIDESPDDTDRGPGGSGGFKSRNAEADFHGKKRSNATHRSTTDPDAKL
jgi:transposase